MKSPGYRLISNNFKALLIFVIIFVANGCQSIEKSNKPNSTVKYQLVSPGSIKIGLLKFDNPSFWSEQKNGELISWTQDGTLLNEIVFGELRKGQNILGQTDYNLGDFDYDPQMSLNLLVEQFTDALTNSTYHNVDLHDRTRLIISGREAVKFKISYDASSNVNYSAWALFIKHGNKLITIFSSAPSRHYFPMFEDNYQKILDSIQMI